MKEISAHNYLKLQIVGWIIQIGRNKSTRIILFDLLFLSPP